MKVKVCNFRALSFEKDFLDSIFETGFAVITHHGIDEMLIKEGQDSWRNFFLADKEYKEHYINKSDTNLGYHGFKKEKALGAALSDLKEFYHYSTGSLLPSGTEANSMILFSQLEDISLQLLKVLDKGHTGRSFSYHDACENTDNTILRALYYPALNFDMERGAVRAAAHEDVNFITLLVAASSAGLEVQDSKGKWHQVPHEENSIVVNIGDMLQLASNEFYKSTTHRVVNPSSNSSDRISLPLFIHPNSSTSLKNGLTAKEFLEERLGSIYMRKLI